MLFLNYCIFSGSAEALVRCGGKLQHLLIAYFIANTHAKYYENPTVLSRVTAKNVGDVFLRHTVVYGLIVCLAFVCVVVYVFMFLFHLLIFVFCYCELLPIR